MAIVTNESQKLRDKLTYLERKLDYASGFNYDDLVYKIDNLINKINRIESDAMTFSIDQNNHVTIKNKIVGRVRALTNAGKEQNPTGSKQQTKTVFYRFDKYLPKPNEQTMFILNMPVYKLNNDNVSSSLNPDLEAAIVETLNN